MFYIGALVFERILTQTFRPNPHSPTLNQVLTCRSRRTSKVTPSFYIPTGWDSEIGKVFEGCHSYAVPSSHNRITELQTPECVHP